MREKLNKNMKKMKGLEEKEDKSGVNIANMEEK